MSNINAKHINKINDMMKEIERKLTCDTDCEREKNIQDLKKRWKKSEEELKILPENVLANEKKFYVAKNGENYYRNNVMRERYIKYIEQWRQDQLNKFEEINEFMEMTLDYYTSQTISKSRINQLLKEVQDKNKVLKKDIDDYYKNTFTAERRVWYQGEENDNLLYWRFYIKIFYFGVILAYVIMGPFIHNQGYKNWKLWLLIILYIVFPFILHYIISFCIYLYRYYNRKAPE